MLRSRVIRSRVCPECHGSKGPRASHCRSCAAKFRLLDEAELKRMSDMAKSQPKPTGWQHSQETRDKIKGSWTEERRREASERAQRQAQDPEWRKSCGRSGPENAAWRDGAGQTAYAPGFSRALKRRIRKRDGYVCQLCGRTEKELGYRLTIHHIDYTKDNHDDENLAAVCKGCNSRVNTNESVWFGYFTALADMRRKLGKDVLKLIGRKVVTQRVGFVTVVHL